MNKLLCVIWPARFPFLSTGVAVSPGHAAPHSCHPQTFPAPTGHQTTYIAYTV